MRTTQRSKRGAAGYGDEASRLVARLPHDLPLVAADASGAVAGFADAVRRRRAGETFLVAPLVDDPRAQSALARAPACSREPAGDARRAAFDALEARPLGDRPEPATPWTIEEPERRVLRDLALMSQGLLVRSRRERARVAGRLGRRPPFAVVAPGVDASVPELRIATPRAIVVWAPHLPMEQLGVIAFALDYLRVPVRYVARDAGGGADALADAACVIDASIADPASAIALARLGVPLLCASTSGAAEFVAGAREYDPWSWRSVFHGVQAARADRAPFAIAPAFDAAEAGRTLDAMAPPDVRDAPLASIVVPTYNHPDRLALVLDNLDLQAYPNVEVVVVNDGGCDVAPIVAAHPRARLVEHPENRGVNQAVLTGFHAARGVYVGALGDDDELFPDHLLRLVDALERTGRGFAHSNTVTRYVRVEDGTMRVHAYRVRHDRTVDPDDLLVGPTYTMQSILYRRTFMEAIGDFDVDCGVADNEYTLRCALADDVVHVDLPTCFWTYDTAGRSLQHAAGALDGYRRVYERYPSASAYVRGRREKWLAEASGTAPGALWPPAFTLPEPD